MQDAPMRLQPLITVWGAQYSPGLWVGNRRGPLGAPYSHAVPAALDIVVLNAPMGCAGWLLASRARLDTLLQLRDDLPLRLDVSAPVFDQRVAIGIGCHADSDG